MSLSVNKALDLVKQFDGKNFENWSTNVTLALKQIKREDVVDADMMEDCSRCAL